MDSDEEMQTEEQTEEQTDEKVISFHELGLDDRILKVRIHNQS